MAVAYLHNTKNGESRVLPLVPAVLEELGTLEALDRSSFKIGAADQLIFHSDKRPDVPYNFVESWRHALKAARVRHFRLHHLRHACASYLAQRGATLLELADVLGHRQMQMVKRYAHLSTQSKAALVKRMLGDLRADLPVVIRCAPPGGEMVRPTTIAMASSATGRNTLTLCPAVPTLIPPPLSGRQHPAPQP